MEDVEAGDGMIETAISALGLEPIDLYVLAATVVVVVGVMTVLGSMTDRATGAS